MLPSARQNESYYFVFDSYKKRLRAVYSRNRLVCQLIPQAIVIPNLGGMMVGCLC